jgi:hypothetical protein
LKVIHGYLLKTKTFSALPCSIWSFFMWFVLGVRKKPIKPKKITEKNRLNRLKFWKNRLVWFGFGFISRKPKKPNRKKPEKKPSQTEPKPEKPSQAGLNRFLL